MNARIYPSVSEAIIKSTDLKFDNRLVALLDKMLTADVMKELCGERYRVLMESITDNNQNPALFTSSTEMYLRPNDNRTKKTFEILILCYASAGVIPVSQPKLGEIVEQFITSSGGWKKKIFAYKDAMVYRLPGSFESGRR